MMRYVFCKSRSSNPYRAASASPAGDQTPAKWSLVSASFRSRKHTHLLHGMQRVSKTTETGAILPSVTTNRYAINADIAQRVTTDDGIIVLRFSERRYLSEHPFLIALICIADRVSPIGDKASSSERGVTRNSGGTTLASDVDGRAGEGAEIQVPDRVQSIDAANAMRVCSSRSIG